MLTFAKTYTYENGNWTANADQAQSVFTPGSGSAVRMSVVYGTTASPSGIANKTVREVTVYDERGNTVWTERQTYTGSGYAQVAWNAYIYDELSRVVNAYSSNGTQNSYTWNCCSKESETLADGTQYTYAYDTLKRLTSKTKVGASGQPNLVTSYTYDAANRQLSETVSAGGLSLAESIEYNPAGQVTRQIDSKGLVTSHTYLNGVNTGTVKGEVTTATLPGGNLRTTENYLDGQSFAVTGNAVIAEYCDYGVNADGSRWTMVRAGRNDSARWQKTTTDMLGRTVKTERSGFGGAVVAQNFYNSKNQLVKTTTTSKTDTLYVYDDLGNLVRTGLDVNANGTLDLASTDRITEQETAFALDNSNWWLVKIGKVYAADGSDTATTTGTTKTRLTGFSGNVVSEVKDIDINGSTTTQTTSIDRNNKTVTQTVNSPTSSVDAQVVTANGLKTSERTTSNLTTTYAYDGLGRQTGVTDPRTGTVTTAYYTDGAGKKGQVYTVTDAANNVTTYDYDTNGRLGSVKNVLNKYTYYAYNALGKTTRVWGDTDYPIENTFDNFGQMTQLKTYRGGAGWTGTSWPTDTGTADITNWTFDEASGLLTAKTYADGKSANYAYSVDGKLSTRTWARQVNSQPLVTTYGYNAATGEMTSVAYSDGTAGITYAYNRLGLKSQVTDAVGSRTFAYNDKLQLLTETISGLYSKTLTRNYAASGVTGRYTGMNIGNEYAVNYGYDNYGRLNSVGSGSDTFSYGYLSNSNLVQSITRPASLSTIFSYEPNRNLITAVENKHGNDLISGYAYLNDAFGRRTSMARSGSAFSTADTLTYGYNDRSEVTSAVSNNISTYNYGYSFDNIGNRLNSNTAETGTSVSTAYTSNSLNQYTAVDTTNPTYDFDGNMLNNGICSFTWNAENQLVKAEKSDAKLEFTYDYMGRRVEKKVYIGSSSSWTLNKHERFVYDEFKQIEKLDALNSNAILQKFIWQPEVLGLDVPLLFADTNVNATCYHFTDANKNIGQLMDGSSNVVGKYEYSPSGKQTVCSGNYAEANPFRFSSEYFDVETLLIYYNYRYYSPELGRWLGRDPIEEQGGINLYSITGNDSINFWDYLGTNRYIDIYNINQSIAKANADLAKLINTPLNEDCDAFLKFVDKEYGLIARLPRNNPS